MSNDLNPMTAVMTMLDAVFGKLPCSPLELFAAFCLWLAAFHTLAFYCIPIIGTAMGNRTLADILHYECHRKVTTVSIEKTHKPKGEK